MSSLLLLPASASGQDARSILERSAELEMMRRDGVNRYTVTQTLMGQQVTQRFERVAVVDPAGNRFETFRQLQPGEVQKRQSSGDPGAMPPEGLETFAAASERVGEGLASEIEAGLSRAGLPKGLLAATTASPYASFDPRVMMRNQALFLRAAAAAQREDHETESKTEAKRDIEGMARFARAARLVGTESAQGRPAFHLRADGLEEGGPDFMVKAVSLWIDVEHYVPLRTTIEGMARSGKEIRPLLIERLDSDYRVVPGSSMYEPYRQTMKMTGIMDARQQAEMKKAQQQLAEFERRLAEMPASQRAMTERTMGSQLATIRKLAAGGGFELEMVTESIRVNEESR